MPGITNAGYQESSTELDTLENGYKNGEPCKKQRNDGPDRKDEKFDLLVAIRNGLEAYVSRHRRFFKALGVILLNAIVLLYFGFATAYWIKEEKEDYRDKRRIDVVKEI